VAPQRAQGGISLKIRTARPMVAIAAALVLTGPIAAWGANEIREGEWQFTTFLQLPGMPQSSGGDQGMTRTACIDAANPIPPDAHCTLGKVDRNAGVVIWSMTCNAPQGPIQAAGRARYSGEKMEATLTARVAGPNGQAIDSPGRVTGHYVGPCTQK
jgi:hypothetical protein